MDRAEVLAWAERHGIKAASVRYRVPTGTVRSWRSRARARAARDAAQRPEGAPSPREQFEDRAAQLAAWAARGACLQCGGDGTVQVPATMRGSLMIRRGRRIRCPTCGGRPTIVQVVEHSPRAWAEGMRVAGDLGAGWTPAQWARIRAGDVDPDGQRITARDRLESGADA